MFDDNENIFIVDFFHKFDFFYFKRKKSFLSFHVKYIKKKFSDVIWRISFHACIFFFTHQTPPKNNKWIICKLRTCPVIGKRHAKIGVEGKMFPKWGEKCFARKGFPRLPRYLWYFPPSNRVGLNFFQQTTDSLDSSLFLFW